MGGPFFVVKQIFFNYIYHMNDYYVYMHIKLDNGEPFYIGKGKSGRAYEKGDRRNRFWNNVVNKYDYDIIFLGENLTNDESIELEKYWVKRIGRRDLGLGPLVNLTDGGEGASGSIPWNKGKKLSEETKLKIGESVKGEKNGMYNKTHSDEVKKKISKINKGRERSFELRKHLSEKLKGVKNLKNSKSVIDINTGVFYNSIKELSELYGYNYQTLKYWIRQGDGYKNKTPFRLI